MPRIDEKFIIRIINEFDSSERKIASIAFDIEQCFEKGLRIKFHCDSIFIPKYALTWFDKPLEIEEFLSILENLTTNRKYGDYLVECTSFGKGSKRNTQKIKIRVIKEFSFNENIRGSEIITRTFTIPDYALQMIGGRLYVKSWVARKKLKINESLEPGVWHNKGSLKIYLLNILNHDVCRDNM